MRATSVALLILCAACAPAAVSAPPAHVVQVAAAGALPAGEDEVTMEVIELMCRPCASRIVHDAKELPGVTSVHMELATKTLTLRFEKALTGRDRVVAAIQDIVSRIQ